MAMHKDMLILGGVSFCFIASQFCFSVYLVLYLTQEMNYPIVGAGRYIALSSLTGAAGRTLWSMASDYFFAGRRKAILLIIALILFLSFSRFQLSEIASLRYNISVIARTTECVKLVIPAKAGIQTSSRRKPGTSNDWMPDQSPPRTRSGVRHDVLPV